MGSCAGQAVTRPDKKCRVLMVDDSIESIALVQSYLKDPGIELTVAHDAREGIAAFQSGFFNLVLMDLNMPEIGGFEAIGEIRRWESEQKLAPTPIAALTALTDFDTAAHSLALGCVLHLAKPITRQTLLQIVNQYSAPPRLMASRFRF